MPENKIKTIVRYYVKQVLNEELGKVMKPLVASSLKEALQTVAPSKRSVKEILEPEVRRQSPQPQHKRRARTPEDFGITDDVWKDVYRDTLQSGNPILTEDPDEEPTVPVHGEVSENILEQMGVMNKDYSAHIGVKKKSESMDDIQTAREERQKRLDEVIKRPPGL